MSIVEAATAEIHTLFDYIRNKTIYKALDSSVPIIGSALASLIGALHSTTDPSQLLFGILEKNITEEIAGATASTATALKQAINAAFASAGAGSIVHAEVSTTNPNAVDISIVWSDTPKSAGATATPSMRVSLT